MALKGNAYASSIVMSQEAANTGRSEKEIKADLDSMKKMMDNPKFVETALKQRFGNDKAALAKEMGNFQGGALDPNKKLAIDDRTVRLAFETVQRMKTQKFIGDVSSWGSTDPEIQKAMDQSAKTTGKRDITNTLAAFLGDSTGAEKIQKLQVFDKLARTAAMKHAKSEFGMPDYSEAGKIIATYAVEQGLFKKFMAEVAKTKIPNQIPANAGIPGLFAETGRQALSAFPDIGDMFKTTPTPINPDTNKPFGE